VRIALLGANAQAGDALGNQLAEKLAFFSDRGADVRVFLESDRRLHPALRAHYQRVTVDDFLRAGTPGSEAWPFLSTADLVLVDYSQYYSLLEVLPLLAGGRPRIVLNYHGVTPAQMWTAHNREGLEQGARYRGLVWCADAVVAHSNFAGRELSAPTRFPTERVSILGHPVRTESFAGQSAACLRAELGLKQATIVLFVGRLAPNKCLAVLVEAIACLRHRTPAVHALIVGDAADIYESEQRACRERAAALGIADRLHFLGHVDEPRLRAAYRSADLFVMPSQHEGFCIPAIEAMASGLPVVAARAGALPETVGDAGLTFEPNDAADLAWQMARVLTPVAEAAPANAGPSRLRLAVVTCRHGDDFAGGAERSLRTLAETLHQAGNQVEVYTTTLRDLEKRQGQYPEGTERLDGIVVHRFRPDPWDPAVRAAAAEAIAQAAGLVAPEVERDFLTHSVRSHRLATALRRQIEQLDAILVGPYLYGLAHDIATAFPEKTVLLPCFHDEPAARLAAFRAGYRQVGAILYHTPEEQRFAEVELGLNHPGAACIGTLVEPTSPGNPEKGRALIGSRRYLIYCGRYSLHKNLPLLFEHARQYSVERPGRFTFVFAGEGSLDIPHEAWARDLGFVTNDVRRDLVAGADALVQLSCNESLSLVALEAWAHGVPVLADARCTVLAGQMRRSGAGWLAGSYQDFAAALDGLWDDPTCGQAHGERGRVYVREQYGCRAAFLAKVETALRELTVPLAERMRRRGQVRARQFDQSVWREQFAALVEDWLQGPERLLREEVEIQPRTSQRTAPAGAEAVLLPVRLVNRGTHVLVPHGPAGVVLRCRVDARRAGDASPPVPPDVPLPGLLMPGCAVTVAVAVPVPKAAGTYRVLFDVVRPQADLDGQLPLPERFRRVLPRPVTVCLTVTPPAGDGTPTPRPLSEAVQTALLAAERLQRLPDDYCDVTQGRLAAWKRRIKEKLLNNFKRAYVDVLSRQQSAFNRHMLSAVEELTESLAALWHQVEYLEGGRRQAEGRAETSPAAVEERMPS
jgi:glycosyltransferase involved in cell wall biosynthesis